MRKTFREALMTSLENSITARKRNLARLEFNKGSSALAREQRTILAIRKEIERIASMEYNVCEDPIARIDGEFVSAKAYSLTPGENYRRDGRGNIVPYSTVGELSPR